jgi:ornithine cyclodeaminase
MVFYEPTHIALFGAPFDGGASRSGAALAPAALRRAGLGEVLARSGLPVRDHGDLSVIPVTGLNEKTPRLRSLDEGAGWTRRLIAESEAALQGGALPVWLGGDHTVSAGTMAGAAAYAKVAGRPLFVLWIDAHPDFNTFDTTLTGNLHGVPVAFACGLPGMEALAGAPLAATLDPANILMLGIRDVDPLEGELLRAHRVTMCGVGDIRETGIDARLKPFLARVADAGGMLHVSFDVDFLDPGVAPGVSTPVASGCTTGEARRILELVRESGLMTSLDIVELNPATDEAETTVGLVVDLIALLFGPDRAASQPTEITPLRSRPMVARHDKINLVPFVSVDKMMKLVLAVGVERFLRELADYIEADFRRWELFDKTPRVASHSQDGVIELMPTSDGHIYGFKYVNGHPKNTRSGLQTVTAFGMLSDVDSGYPLLLSEMTILTALRTAATSAVAAKYLAPRGARTMAVIGNGAQSEFQALAFKALLGIDRLRLYDIDPAATERCARNLAGAGFAIVKCRSAEEAVEGAQIITTATADKQYATILTDNMVGAGVHINAVGGDSPGKTELHRDILLRSSIFVEYPPQTRIEGEIQQLPVDYPVTELWRVMTGSVPGRRTEREITLFDSVGFATEDFSALRYVRDQIERTGLYDNLDLLADPDDPRDLYGMILRAARPAPVGNAA